MVVAGLVVLELVAELELPSGGAIRVALLAWRGRRLLSREVNPTAALATAPGTTVSACRLEPQERHRHTPASFDHLENFSRASLMTAAIDERLQPVQRAHFTLRPPHSFQQYAHATDPSPAHVGLRPHRDAIRTDGQPARPYGASAAARRTRRSH